MYMSILFGAQVNRKWVKSGPEVNGKWFKNDFLSNLYPTLSIIYTYIYIVKILYVLGINSAASYRGFWNEFFRNREIAWYYRDRLINIDNNNV